MEIIGDFEEELKGLRECFKSGKTKELSWRKTQLKGLLKFLHEKEEHIFKALYQDLGKHNVEAFRDEVGMLTKSARYALKGVTQWMAPKKIPLPLAAFPSTAKMVPEPLGVVLIFSSWNFPFGLSLEPLIGAIAAGNTVVVKPSELAPASSSILATLLPLYLDSKAIKIIEGGVDVAELLLEKKWDKIFFTGSTRVGRAVMTAAAKHLTPVTLELGGKCPAVVDSLNSSWDLKIAVKRILGGKYASCGGQACIGIDYVLVDEKFAPKLVDSIKVAIKKMFGDNPKETNSISRIINKQRFLRLKSMLNDDNVKASIVFGGSCDEENLFIEPTVLLDPPLKADIMSEEIFGPLLPIITLKNIEDSIGFINSKPNPLALYVFTNNETLKSRMVSETSSGSLTFNDAIIHYLLDTVPFGGVGQSGFGTYHGKYSFDTFSHEKPVLRSSYLSELWFRYPPWTAHRFNLIRNAIVFNYLGFILVLLGLKRS
ncbi:Aldehyde dehydrogenase [Thalictrum thalictroides]|uniref:Aldehyde dehydrogenase n=1 Tax=Thalictrum thalictroides TaxID=46969 RepID=A0A7J6XH20_THATH|nr:Aldehyde dehydrogenase [Thalictrum thalictroides]